MIIFKHYNNEKYYNIDDFPYHLMKINDYSNGRKGILYPDLFMTFDIETTSTVYEDEYIGYMYIWQLCIGDTEGKARYAVHGRTWYEFFNFMTELKKHIAMREGAYIVCYVHNLSFEYQFLRTITPFLSTFATEERKVLKCNTDWIEYRCSYKLSNMSLDKFCKYSGAKHKKATEYFNYSKTRTPETPLTELEYYYTYCDVVGLHESVCKLLEEDTLGSIPLTSTGYVRRDCRNAAKKNVKNWYWFQKCAMNKEVYTLISEASRGGDTHCNRHYAGKILKYVDNYDFSSSYPYCLCCMYYPNSAFTKVRNITNGQFHKYLEKFCCLFRIHFKNFRIKKEVTNPYVSLSKCYDYPKKKEDKNGLTIFNGRVMYASVIGMTLTELDFDIIQQEYTWDAIAVSDLHIATRGKLPKEIREQVIKYYVHKTELKGVDDYLYAKDKNKLNAIFGMAFTNPIRGEYFIDTITGKWYYQEPDIEKALKDYRKNRNNFLPYVVGMYTTAHARHNLRDMIHIAGIGNVYNDTDSTKIWGVDVSKEVEVYNEKVKKIAIENGAYATDKHGVVHYMGVAEQEESYKYFRSWGAKKYCYVDQKGKLHLTLAGVDKKKGVMQMDSIHDFKLGKLFLPDCGRRTVRYNDWLVPKLITIEGCTFLSGAGIHMENGTYKLGVTDEFTENLSIPVDILNEL